MGHRNFATSTHVRDHLARILPDDARRAMCLSILADSIDRLHSKNPAHWATYCDGDQLRLRGGGLIVLTIENSRLWLALDQAAIDASGAALALARAPDVKLDTGKWAHYKRPHTTNIFYAPSAKTADTWPLIKPLHFALLDRVAKHALKPDSQNKHQPAVSEYLGVLLRRQLPEPVYDPGVEAAPQSELWAPPHRVLGDDLRVPPASEYARVLGQIRVSTLQRRILEEHYRAPDRTGTATDLAALSELTGGFSAVNLHYGRLCEEICRKLHFDPGKRDDGTTRWWRACSVGWHTPAGFMWRMRPQIARALQHLLRNPPFRPSTSLLP